MGIPINIPDVWRVVLLWDTARGVTPRQRLHFVHAGGTESDLGAVLDAHFTLPMFDSVGNAWSFNKVEITRLDGISAAVEYNLAATRTGGTAGEAVPATCAVLSIKTPQRGPRGRGRIYLGPIAETKQHDGTLSDPGTMQVAWFNFNVAMSLATYPLTVASYKHLDHHPVTDLRIDSLIGTQRRRQRQLSP
jgi:hypothetical protein